MAAVPPDRDLLRRYAELGDEAAFTELVRRRTDFVYATAQRLVGTAPMAEDITQAVFLKLARHAQQLRNHDALAGWLHTATRHAAIDAIRTDARRRAREHEATAMHHDAAPVEPNWENIRPLLDEAVGKLREHDRAAIVLRYFQGLSHEQVGEELGLGKEAARKRVERALEKMRSNFARKGVTISGALLAEAINAHAAQSAPAGLPERVAAKSLTSAATPAGISAFFTLTLMNTKIKILIAVAVIVALLLVFKFYFIVQSPITADATGVNKSLPLIANSTAGITIQTKTAPVVVSPTTVPAAPSNPANITVDAGLPGNDTATRADFQSLAKAYLAYSSSSPNGSSIPVNPGDTAHNAAMILAQIGLNDARLYFSKGDPALPKTLPKTVNNGDLAHLTDDFAAATLSVEIAANLPPNVPMPSTTPVMWTRGLTDDGTWTADSPYGGRGGFIAYLDGHAEWVDGRVTNLTVWGTHQFTSNIREALPPDAVILSAKPNQPKK